VVTSTWMRAYGISCFAPSPPSAQVHQLMLDLTTEKLGRLEVLERRCIRADEVPTAREGGGWELHHGE